MNLHVSAKIVTDQPDRVLEVPETVAANTTVKTAKIRTMLFSPPIFCHLFTELANTDKRNESDEWAAFRKKLNL